MNSGTQIQELMPYALKVGAKIAKEYIAKGDYFPKESWGCEGQIYPSQMGIALLELYKVTKDPLLLEGVEAVIESNIKKQMPSGGWPLLLAANGNGIKFEIGAELMEITASMEDLPPTVCAIRLMADYKVCTSSTAYDDALDKAYEYLLSFWNEENGAFDEMLKGEALKLRASPRDYHIYAFKAINSLSKIYPDAERFLKPLYASVKATFEEMNQHTYPLLHAMHAALIILEEGNNEYVLNVVKDRISNQLTFKSPFRIKELPGAMGHHDGLRGIHLDEGHLRNSIGVALIMKFYDTYVEKDEYTKSTFYNELKTWIMSMYKDGLFYEFQDIQTGDKIGVGTPGQFLPIFWILGKL